MKAEFPGNLVDQSFNGIPVAHPLASEGQ